MPTLLDIAKRNAADPMVGLIDEASRMVPEVSGQTNFLGRAISIPGVGAARTIRGLQYKTLVRTALPTVGFRHANEGTVAQNSTYENRLVECFILNPRWECDKALADRSEDGPLAYIAEEAQALLNASMMHLGRQFYYGATTPGDTKGCPGLLQSVDASMVVNANGTTANTGSSVWAVSFGPQRVQWVLGAEGQMSVSDIREESIDAAGGGRFTAYVQELLAYVGVQVGNRFSIGRIRNLTADSGRGLTNALLSDLLSRFPVGYRPDAFFCSRRSLSQLQASRTATTTTGAEAPIPQDFEGIPIIPTDSILDTESLA